MSLCGRYVSTFFHASKRHTCAILENVSNALHSLRKDSNIVISKSDKGNGVVVLNSADNVAKMQTILCDTNKFQPLDNDNNVANLLKFQNCLRHLKVKRQLMKTRTGRSIQLLSIHQQCMVFLKYMSLTCLYDQFCHLQVASATTVPSGCPTRCRSFATMRPV